MEDALVLRALEVLKRASKHLQSITAGREDDEEPVHEGTGSNQNRFDLNCSNSLKALLALEVESGSCGILSADPDLSDLRSLLSRLKELCISAEIAPEDSGGNKFKKRFRSATCEISTLDSRDDSCSDLMEIKREMIPILSGSEFGEMNNGNQEDFKRHSHQISVIAKSIETEIETWMDREIVRRILSSLRSISTSNEKTLAWLLQSFLNILSRGFDRKLQDLLLRSGIFPAITSTMASNSTPIIIKDLCAVAISSMVKFNRDVFVGYVLMGGSSPVHRSLAAMATTSSIRVLLFLVSSIKTAIVDELHSSDQLPSLVSFLSSSETAIAESGLELVLKIAYYARKEAVEAMIGAGLVEKLVRLQLSELGGAVMEMEEERRGRPFVSCVKRFAVQVEVGRGMGRREKAEAKGIILGKVKTATGSDADAAAIAVEVLWGSAP